MNYPFPMPSPYIQAALNQAIQAFMSGGALPPGCVIMALPYPQSQQMLPQLMMNPAITGHDPMIYSQQTPYYGPSPYTANPQTHGLPAPQQNYNYPIVPYNYHNNNNTTKHSKKKPQQPHSNIYNSSSFDSYMDGLSWSRLFERPTRKNSKQTNQDHASINYDKKSNSSKKHRSNSGTSSSTTSDETIRRVNVINNPTTSSNTNSKQQTKGSLPFKYSSEFVPGVGKQQPHPQAPPPPPPQHHHHQQQQQQQQQNSQKIKSNDVFIVKKA